MTCVYRLVWNTNYSLVTSQKLKICILTILTHALRTLFDPRSSDKNAWRNMTKYLRPQFVVQKDNR